MNRSLITIIGKNIIFNPLFSQISNLFKHENLDQIKRNFLMEAQNQLNNQPITMQSNKFIKDV